jgi:hypothetical protein
VHQQLMARLAFHQPMEVVHPRIVAAHMATADHQQLARLRRQCRASAQVFEHRHWGCLDRLAGGFQAISEVRLQRPQIEAMGMMVKRCNDSFQVDASP